MKHYLVIFSLLMTLSPLPARAGGIPVFDAANLQQTTLSAIEAVNQTLNQGILTRDLGGQASTAEMTAAIIGNL